MPPSSRLPFLSHADLASGRRRFDPGHALPGSRVERPVTGSHGSVEIAVIDAACPPFAGDSLSRRLPHSKGSLWCTTDVRACVRSALEAGAAG